MFLRVTLHENVVLRQQERGDLGQLSHGRTMGVRYNRSKLVEGVVQVVHPSAFPRVYVQPHALTLSRALGFRWAVQPRRARSAKDIERPRLRFTWLRFVGESLIGGVCLTEIPKRRCVYV